MLSPNFSNDLGGDGITHGFSDSKKLTRTLVDATDLQRRKTKINKNNSNSNIMHQVGVLVSSVGGGACRCTVVRRGVFRQ